MQEQDCTDTAAALKFRLCRNEAATDFSQARIFAAHLKRQLNLFEPYVPSSSATDESGCMQMHRLLFYWKTTAGARKAFNDNLELCEARNKWAQKSAWWDAGAKSETATDFLCLFA